MGWNTSYNHHAPPYKPIPTHSDTHYLQTFPPIAHDKQLRISSLPPRNIESPAEPHKSSARRENSSWFLSPARTAVTFSRRRSWIRTAINATAHRLHVLIAWYTSTERTIVRIRVVSVKHRSTKEHCIDRRRRRRTGTTINIRTTRRLLYNIPHTSKMPTMSTTTTRTSRLSSHRCRKLPLLHLPSQDSSSHQVQSMFSISW